MNDEFIVATGKIIKEYLVEYDINQKELSARSGMSEKHISNVLNGNARLTEEFALKLERILVGVPASYWLNYEAKYRERLARQEDLYKISTWNLDELSKRFYFKEVFRGLELPLEQQAIEMLKLLKISDYANFKVVYQNLLTNCKGEDGEKEAVAIWLNQCESEIEIQNLEINLIPYKKRHLKAYLDKFRVLTSTEDVGLSLESCRKLCNQSGVYLVICEAIANSKVRGALTTYKGHPAIYLSNRFKSDEHIGGAFIHEIAHLLLHYNKKDTLISFAEEEAETGIVDSKEEEANSFTRDFFLDSKACLSINKPSSYD